MAFSGVELLEVMTTSLDDGGVIVKGDNKALVATYKRLGNGSLTIIDTSTGESLYYGAPLPYAQAGAVSGISGCWNGSEFLIMYASGSPMVRSFSRVSPSGDITYSETRSGTGTTIVANSTAALYRPVSTASSISVAFTKIDLSTNTVSSAVSGQAIGMANDQLYITDGPTVHSYDPLTNTKTAIVGLVVTPIYRGITSGNWIWWRTTSGTTPFVGYNWSTNQTKRVNITPATDFPSLGTSEICFDVLDNVIYCVVANKVLAIDIATGRWKYDDPVTVRTGRFGLIAANGKLWIPSTVTP